VEQIPKIRFSYPAQKPRQIFKSLKSQILSQNALSPPSAGKGGTVFFPSSKQKVVDD